MCDLSNQSIFVAGHNGMVGSAVTRYLKKENLNLITADKSELNLKNQTDVFNWFKKTQPEIVILCAAKVGGILANKNFPADFIYDNIMIQSNVINASKVSNVKKLLFLGSSCIYPKFANQPIEENSLLKNSLESTNEFYAIAKIAGVKMCQAYRRQFGSNFISAMPTNLYGPNDNYDLENSHVIPALIKKISIAKENNFPNVTIWGSGEPRREFLHVDDCVEAIIFLLKKYSEYSHINIGTGNDIKISELASLICEIVEYDGELIYDSTRPDGTPRKLLNISKIKNLGWSPKINLKEGLKRTIKEYKSISKIS